MIPTFILLLVPISSQDFSEIYSAYDRLTMNLFNSFPHKSCINFNNKRISEICQNEPPLNFLSQFTVIQSLSCEEDKSHYEKLQNLLKSQESLIKEKIMNHLKKPKNQQLIQNEKFLHGEKFYDPPSVESVAADLKLNLVLLCNKFKLF